MQQTNILLNLDNVLVGRQKKFLKTGQIIIEQLKQQVLEEMFFKIFWPIYKLYTLRTKLYLVY